MTLAYQKDEHYAYAIGATPGFPVQRNTGEDLEHDRECLAALRPYVGHGMRPACNAFNPPQLCEKRSQVFAGRRFISIKTQYMSSRTGARSSAG
jgi:hypothetical protein